MTASWSDAGEGERLWFLGTLATIRVGADAADGRFTLIEFLLPHGASPPRHTHPQDESYGVPEAQPPSNPEHAASRPARSPAANVPGAGRAAWRCTEPRPAKNAPAPTATSTTSARNARMAISPSRRARPAAPRQRRPRSSPRRTSGSRI